MACSYSRAHRDRSYSALRQPVRSIGCSYG
jgi:hypothetical protein